MYYNTVEEIPAGVETKIRNGRVYYATETIQTKYGIVSGWRPILTPEERAIREAEAYEALSKLGSKGV